MLRLAVVNGKRTVGSIKELTMSPCPRPSWHSNNPVCLTPTGEGAPSKIEGVGGVCSSHSKGASLWQVVDSVHGLIEKGHP